MLKLQLVQQPLASVWVDGVGGNHFSGIWVNDGCGVFIDEDDDAFFGVCDNDTEVSFISSQVHDGPKPRALHFSSQRS